jgi:hypothetical protein
MKDKGDDYTRQAKQVQIAVFKNSRQPGFTVQAPRDRG